MAMSKAAIYRLNCGGPMASSIESPRWAAELLRRKVEGNRSLQEAAATVGRPPRSLQQKRFRIIHGVEFPTRLRTAIAGEPGASRRNATGHSSMSPNLGAKTHSIAERGATPRYRGVRSAG
jgi:hypothetical protein